jgi:hypothetical protein
MTQLNGLHVFPCKFNKAPAIAGGFYSASNDPAIIALWQKRYFLFGAPTGAVNGFDVLDVDPRHGGDAWLASQDLPETRVHETRSGGRHYFFKHRPGLQCNESRIAPGVDVRTTGGYVIWWPMAGRRVLSDAPIVDWPVALIEVLHDPITTKPSINPSPYLLSLVSINNIRQELPKPFYKKVMAAMRGAPGHHQKCARGLLCYALFQSDGRQNHGLNYAAFRFRKLVNACAIPSDDAEALLFEVAGLNGFIARHSEKEATDVIRCGLGLPKQQTPRTINGGMKNMGEGLTDTDLLKMSLDDIAEK